MTYEELIERASTGDPLIHPERPAVILQKGLFIPGISSPEEEALDLLVKIENGGLRAWVRDPAGTAEPFLGHEWCEEAFFEEYEDLVHWAYAW